MAAPGVKLHVGCGRERLEGWVNLDTQSYPGVDVVADVTEGLDFSEVEAVYAEHFLEHLTIAQALDFLLECHRVLRDGGLLRLTTPNLDWAWKSHYWLEDTTPELKRQMAFALNLAFYGWEHRFLWNRETLERALTACGFGELAWPDHGESEHELFRGIERHRTYENLPGLPHVLIVDARKGAPAPEALAAFRRTAQESFLDHMKG